MRARDTRARTAWPILVCILVVQALAAARADELPRRKPGLWESTLHLETSRRPPPRTRLCLDEATDALSLRYALGLAKERCSQMEIKRSGREFTIRSTCDIGQHRITTQSVMTFDGDTAYHYVAQSHYDPPLNGRSETRTEQDGRWIGACEPGQKPGDMVIDPPGIRMNVRDALGRN